MKRSFRLPESAITGWQLSGLGHSFPPAFHARCPFAFGHSRLASAPVTRYSRPGAFTLIELLIVVAIIAILAGLTISILGVVQGKGARSRAQTEVASVSAAIDSYFLDRGSYPPMDSGASNSTTQLYTALCGGEKVYLEAKPSMLQTNATQTNFVDPWGENYFYSTNPAVIRNVGSFDFWSRAGTTNKTTDDISN